MAGWSWARGRAFSSASLTAPAAAPSSSGLSPTCPDPRATGNHYHLPPYFLPDAGLTRALFRILSAPCSQYLRNVYHRPARFYGSVTPRMACWIAKGLLAVSCSRPPQNTKRGVTKMRMVGIKTRERTKAAAAVRPPTSEAQVAGLIRQAARGNFEAFGEIYSFYLDRIYRYVYYQVRDKMLAEDITEEVFLKAWKAIRTCRGRESTFSAWLYRIAHNHVINSLRNRQKQSSLEDMEIIDNTQDPTSISEIGQEYRDLLDGIRHLPENQQQVIILKFIEGMDNREISRITGKTEGAIRVAQMRGLLTLRERLNGG
ncbi:MAG: sigma-70 family RNA polymerase sigma factor [Chloroflexota bacterium]